MFTDLLKPVCWTSWGSDLLKSQLSLLGEESAKAMTEGSPRLWAPGRYAEGTWIWAAGACPHTTALAGQFCSQDRKDW